MGTKMIEMTYNELVELRNNSKLISGCMYKITDYVTTSTDPETKVANNQFDIVVRALDESHLFEEARICKHEEEDLPLPLIKYAHKNTLPSSAWQNAH